MYVEFLGHKTAFSRVYHVVSYSPALCSSTVKCMKCKMTFIGLVMLITKAKHNDNNLYRWKWVHWRTPARWLRIRRCSWERWSPNVRWDRCWTSTLSPCAWTESSTLLSMEDWLDTRRYRTQWRAGFLCFWEIRGGLWVGVLFQCLKTWIVHVDYSKKIKIKK